MTTTASTDATTTKIQETSRFNDQFGEMNPRAKEKVKGEMSDFVQKFISASPFVVMASADPDGNCDASPKGGKPGFVKVIDGQRLLLPDVAGNRLFQSYQNMDENPHVGLLFMIPGVNDTVRINGTISIVNREETGTAEGGTFPVLDRRQRQAPAGHHHQRGRVIYPLPAGLQFRQAVGHRADNRKPDQPADPTPTITRDQLTGPLAIRPSPKLGRGFCCHSSRPPARIGSLRPMLQWRHVTLHDATYKTPSTSPHVKGWHAHGFRRL